MDYKGSKHIVMSKVQVQDTFQRVFGDENVPMHRGTGSNLGQGGGGGSISKKGTLFYFGKQTEKPNFKK